MWNLILLLPRLNKANSGGADDLCSSLRSPVSLGYDVLRLWGKTTGPIHLMRAIMPCFGVCLLYCQAAEYLPR